jgi:hypothetical protein
MINLLPPYLYEVGTCSSRMKESANLIRAFCASTAFLQATFYALDTHLIGTKSYWSPALYDADAPAGQNGSVMMTYLVQVLSQMEAITAGGTCEHVTITKSKEHKRANSTTFALGI